MDTEHTPTPWHVATNPGGPGDQPAFPSIRDPSGSPHGEDIVAMPCGNSETVKANAEFIVRACNSHEKLLAALEQCHDAILAMQTNHCALLKTPPYEDVRLYALATLAKAKGE